MCVLFYYSNVSRETLSILKIRNVSRETFRGDKMNEKYIDLALKEAYKSYKKGDVPVGAIIVKNNKIIAKAHNQKEKKQNCIKHAEIIAIEKACKKNKNWRLDDCEIYITMEPCVMCCGAILQSRINKIVYSIKNENYGGIDILKTKNKKIEIISRIKENESKKMVQEFFKKRR